MTGLVLLGLGAILLTLYGPPRTLRRAPEALRGLAVRHEAELKAQRGDGATVAVHVLAQSLTEDPRVRGVVLTLRDIHDCKALEAQLTHQALHDPLTGLAHRSLVADRLQHAMARRPEDRRQLTVLMLDLHRRPWRPRQARGSVAAARARCWPRVSAERTARTRPGAQR